MKSNKWQTHRRRKRLDICKGLKPWQKSTGPRSALGKTTSAQNARKHGGDDADMRALRHLLTLQARFLDKIMDIYGDAP